MPRNRDSEKTVERILSAAQELFVEQGYEHTSIQDILDRLGDLSKGAIYYHFKSKEDIMMAVIERLYAGNDERWAHVVADSNLTGLEKLRGILRTSVEAPEQNEMFSSAPDLLKSPAMLAEQIRSIAEDSAPVYVQPLIEQGVRDGSIPTRYPRELAEVILLLINVWLSPLVFHGDMAQIERRTNLFRQMLEGIGVQLLDDDMVARYREFCRLYQKNR